MPDGLALYYSVTANPYEPLLNFIGRYVDGFRVVSRGELEHLKRAGLAGIGMTFAGPGKRDDELEAGIAAGATISVESEGEAGRAIRAGERVGIQPKLAVRVNPPFSIDHGRLTYWLKSLRPASDLSIAALAAGSYGPFSSLSRMPLFASTQPMTKPTPDMPPLTPL